MRWQSAQCSYSTGFALDGWSAKYMRRHPDVEAEIDRVCQEHLAKLVKGLTRPRKTIDYFSVSPQRLAKPTSRLHVQSGGFPARRAESPLIEGVDPRPT